MAYIETPVGSGSGALIDGGYLVTNAHVVWPFKEVRVVFADGSEHRNAPVMNWDLLGDLAIIGPLTADADPLQLEDGEYLPIGSAVFLLGYPAEAEEFPQPTITQGILSRVREWQTLGITYLQTDAAVTGGQSGGVLISQEGKVIGISGLRFSDASFGLVASGIDVLPRVLDMIDGKDVAGLGERPSLEPIAETGSSFRLRDDRDTRAFYVEVPHAPKIDFQIEGDNDGAVGLYDLFGNQLVNINEGITGAEFGSAETMPDSPYFIVAYQNNWHPGTFDVSSTEISARVGDVDDNSNVRVGETVVGNMDHPVDFDTFLITLKEGDIVDVVIDSMSIDPVLYVDFLGSRIAEIVSDDDSGGGILGTDAKITFQAPHTGSYQIVVTDAFASSIGGYFLTVSMAPEGATPVALPPPLEKVETPLGTMAVYESERYPFSIQYFDGWREGVSGNPDIPLLLSGENGEVFRILEQDLAAAGMSDITHAELLDLAFSQSSGLYEVKFREPMITSQGLTTEIMLTETIRGQTKNISYLGDDNIFFMASYQASKEHFERVEQLANHSFGTFQIEGLPLAPPTPVPTPTPTPSPAQAAFSEGVELAGAGEHERAIERFNEAIRLDPSYAVAYNDRGVAYINLGEFGKALPDVTKAIRLDLTNTITYYNQGIVYANLGEFERAIQSYDETIRLDPAYPSAHFNRGLAYHNLGEFERAIQNYDETIRLDPVNVTVRYNRGLAYQNLGEHELAIQDYDEAIRLDPAYVAAYNNRGSAYRNLGEHELAIQDYDEAIRLDTDDANYYANRAGAYTMLGRDVEAERDLERAVELGYNRATLEGSLERLKGQRPSAPTIAIEDDTAVSGRMIFINGTGFQSFSTISTLTIGGVPVSDIDRLPPSDSSGVIRAAVFVPQLSVGTHEVVVTVAGISVNTNLAITRSIESLDAQVTAMKFFEGPPILPPGADRNYLQSFGRLDARYIYWELSLVHPPPGQQKTLSISAVYSKSDGTEFTRHTYSTPIRANAVNTTHIKGSGFSETGQWSVDSYRVDLSVDGVLVASETFHITE